MDQTNIFDEFDPPSLNEWLELARSEAKANGLEWQSREGITVRPLRTRDEVKSLSHMQVPAGQPPYVRGGMPPTGGRKWQITEEINTADPLKANRECREAVDGGATALRVIVDSSGNNGVCIQSRNDVAVVLKDLPLYKLPLTLVLSSDALAQFSVLTSSFEEPSRVPFITVEVDPLSDTLVFGHNGFGESAMQSTATVTAYARSVVPHMKTLCASSEPYHNAGANSVFELACTLASGFEYLRSLGRWLSVDDVAERLRFRFSVGSNFFFELAKLRAARMLWAKIAHHCGARNTLVDMQITSSKFMMTKYDPHVNILRETLQAMAGVFGGADSITLQPFDLFSGEKEYVAKRLARNTQLILTHEAYLAYVQDVAAGSYYIETLTDEIGRSAWSIFQNIESQGGLLASLKAGWIQEQVAAQAEAKRKDIATRNEVFIGTTQYPNPNESQQRTTAAKEKTDEHNHDRDEARINSWLRKVRESAEIDPKMFEYCLNAAKAGASVDEIAGAIPQSESVVSITPLRIWRATEEVERLRSRIEGMEHPLSAFLASFGNAVARNTRMDFAMNFLGIAGIRSTRKEETNTVSEALEAALHSNARIVVACSDDDSYRTELPAMVRELKSRKPEAVFVVAGYPEDAIDMLLEAGVDAFMHAQSDVVGVLRKVCEVGEQD